MLCELSIALNKRCNTLAKVLHPCLFTLYISDDFENTLGVFSFFLQFFPLLKFLFIHDNRILAKRGFYCFSAFMFSAKPADSG